MKLRERLDTWLWRAGFAGLMMTETRCNMREAFRRADDFRMLQPNWRNIDPAEAARSKLWIYKK